MPEFVCKNSFEDRLTKVKSKAFVVNKKWIELNSMHDALLEARKISQKNAVDSERWLLKQPKYLEFLHNLQIALQKENIGTFSTLLTHLTREVLGNNKEIVFELHTKKDSPSLTIEAVNDSCKESIMDGSGGAVVNIVSTGLRLIALSRTQTRQFIILDEPDCWLEPIHVPVFAKLLGELSEKLNIQIVLISHHKWEYFEQYGKIIQINQNKDGLLLAQTISDKKAHMHEQEHADFISNVKIINFMSHEDTEINLSPYLNCIIGKNDIGKSVIASAFKAVCYGQSSDSYIKHHTNKAEVLLSLSNGNQIKWERIRSTTSDFPQKVRYTAYFNGEVTGQQYESKECPDFIKKILNIEIKEGMDLHIGNQKQPVFLLSDDTRGQQKAKILSVGKESIYVQKIMEYIKEETREQKIIFKTANKEISEQNKKISGLHGAGSRIELLEKIINGIHFLEDRSVLVSKLQKTIQKTKGCFAIAGINLSALPVGINKLRNTSRLEYLLGKYNRFIQVSKIGNIKDSKAYSINTIKNLKQLNYFLKKYHFYYLAGSIKKITQQETNWFNELKNIKRLDSAIEQFKPIYYTALITKITELSKHVGFNQTIELHKSINRIKKASKALSINKIDIPDIKNNLGFSFFQLRELLDSIKEIKKYPNDFPEAIALSVLPPNKKNRAQFLMKLREDVSLYQKLKEDITNLESLRVKHSNELEQRLNEYIKENGEICPLCLSNISFNHYHLSK